MTDPARASGKIVIVGAGGFAAEAAWVIEDMHRAGAAHWTLLGYVDDDRSKRGRRLYDYETLGTPEDLAGALPGEALWYYCAIGGNRARQAVALRLDAMGWKAATLIHPSVIIARHVIIGEGTYVGAGSILCPNVVIGRHVVINVRVAVGHDARLGDYSQASPGAQINGACEVGEGATIGSNASIHPKKSVGANAVVGANAQVIRSVPPGVSVSGVPATRAFRSTIGLEQRNDER